MRFAVSFYGHEEAQGKVRGHSESGKIGLLLGS